ncbi:MAG: DUF928 domain-containing protein [Pseudanabaenaceae cyanobacterium]
MFFPSAILPQKFLTTIGLSSFLTLGVGLGLGSTTQASFAQQASTYGLGMPGSASTGGATRGTICATIATLTTNPSNTSPTKCMDSFPRIILLSPEDGSRTSVSRPTFYWYVTGSSGEDSQQFKVTFVLRDGATEEASPIYRTELVTDRPGLYRFTLPSEVELKPGQPQRWQIRWQSASGSNTANANAAVMWQAKDPQISQQLAGMNNLEKARWYKQNGYWYDAVAAYTLWLEQDNPKDTTARSERTEILNAGLATQVNLTKDAKQQPDPAKLEYFLQKLNDTAFANDLPAASTNELVP